MDRKLEQDILDRVSHIPIVDSLKINIVECSPGYCKATSPYLKKFEGIYESTHGGILMTLADSIACFALMTQTGADEVLTTTDMNIRFLAPCLSDATIVARVIKLGKTLCPVAVDLFDAQEKLVAVSQVTYMRLAKMPAREQRTS